MKKIIIATATMMLAFSFNSFAGTPENKGEAKNETKVEAPAEINNEATATNYHWYSVDGTVEYGYGPNPIDSPCGETGSGCAKGFLSEPNNPISDPHQDERGLPL